MVNQSALVRFEGLKTATLELSATCSRPSASEAEIRKGMAELGCALHEIEGLWEDIDVSKRTAYEQQANSTQLMALKHVRNMNGPDQDFGGSNWHQDPVPGEKS